MERGRQDRPVLNADYKIKGFCALSWGRGFRLNNQPDFSFSNMFAISFQTLLFATSIPTAFALLYLALLVHYELFLSPLSSYPGPFLARISSIHNLYHAFKKDIHLDIWKQHEYYGNSHLGRHPCR